MSVARCCALSAITVFMLGRAAAAEPVFRDLNMSLEVQPADFDYTYQAPDEDSLSSDDSFDSLIGLSVGWRQSFTPPGWSHGPVVGLHATGLIGTYDNAADYLSLGLRLTPGWAFALNDEWTILAGPYVEYGFGTWEFPDNTIFDGFTVDGDYLAYGMNIHALYALTPHWQLDVAVGYRDRHHELSGSGNTIEMDNTGILGLVGISYRFSAAPTRLE